MSITATGAAAPAPAIPVENLNLGPYNIQYLPGDHYVLDVSGGNPAKGAGVIGYTLKLPQAGNQQWLFVPAPQAPGWWYLQTKMGTGFVLTLQPDSPVVPTPVVMMPVGLSDADRQLWSLLSTEEPGYWYIQCKSGASNSNAPLVIGLADNKVEASAVAGPISFTGFRAQAWGFKPVGSAG